jgi:hypothetical protein
MITYDQPDWYVEFPTGLDWRWAKSPPVVRLRHEGIQAAGNIRVRPTSGSMPSTSVTTVRSRSKDPTLRVEAFAFVFDRSLTGQVSSTVDFRAVDERVKSSSADRRLREVWGSQMAYPENHTEAPKLVAFLQEPGGGRHEAATAYDVSKLRLRFMVVPVLGELRYDPVSHPHGYIPADIPALGQPSMVTEQWLYALEQCRELATFQRNSYAARMVAQGRADDLDDGLDRLAGVSLNRLYREIYFDKASFLSNAKATLEGHLIDDLLRRPR